MKPSVSRLAETIRALKISTVEKDGVRKPVLGRSPEEVPNLLLEIYDALESFDKDGAAEVEGERKSREALDSVLRWIRAQGLSLDEPVAIIAETLGVSKGKRQASYDILPEFAPQHNRDKGSWKPVLTLPKDRLSSLKSISDHRKVSQAIDQVVDRLGHVAPKVR